MKLYANYLKRGLDIILAVGALIILAPVFIGVAVLIRSKLGSPVLFKQARPGRDEKIFHMYKFRTMTNATDAEGHLLADEERMTPFGMKLRVTSLDELPELFNIIKGDMSIVGPRPLLIQYLPLYNEEQKRRHEVRPGLTGLAQAKGRNAISWVEKFAYDVEYVDNISFRLDVKIILLTIGAVFKQEGIAAEDSLSMEAFQGNDRQEMAKKR